VPPYTVLSLGRPGTQDLFTPINWVYHYHGIVHSVLVNGGVSLQILRVAANVVNDWLQTADRAVLQLGT
jgi:hypothetical protein